MADTLTRIVNVTSERLNVSADNVKLESKFVEDLGADSLDLVELVMGFEEEFDVEIDDETSERVVSVQDALDVVNERLG